MYKDTQEDRNKTVEFMKKYGLYNPILSAEVMQYCHDVYHRAIEVKQLTIEELREQFNNLKDIKPHLNTNKTMSEMIDGLFAFYFECARANNLIKE